MIAIEQFGMNPEQNGMMLSYIGSISLFMQGFGIATLTKRAPDKVLMALSTSTLTVSYFIMVNQYPILYLNEPIHEKTFRKSFNNHTILDIVCVRCTCHLLMYTSVRTKVGF